MAVCVTETDCAGQVGTVWYSGSVRQFESLRQSEQSGGVDISETIGPSGVVGESVGFRLLYVV